MDVETRRPIGLLPDREASSLAAWLAQWPGVVVIFRGRAPLFAEGGGVGALRVIQVVGWWYFCGNVSD
ncbi:ISL3 family transposase, partial [Streptomyces mutomycini]